MKYNLIYFVFTFSIVLIDSVKFRCDYNFTDLGWFKYHKIPAIWSDARLMCQLEGAILASPTTAKMKTAMIKLVGKTDVFTGIHATFSKGHHYHSIDGVSLVKMPHEWANLEPDNKNNAEHCIAMDCEGKIADVRCDEVRPYICHREHSYVDATICGTPDPEYHFDSRTNKCYKFHTTPRSFDRAHFACSAEGGHLVIINSEEESKVLKELYSRYLDKMLGNFRKDVAFIGFHNWGEGGDWRTIHGETIQKAGFAKFEHGTPNNRSAGEYCGSILPNGLLNDLWCEEHYAFICEKEADYPLVCDNVVDESDIQTY